MEFECKNCGEKVDSVILDGYVVGHMTKNLTERDLEGVEFEVNSSEGEVGVEDISSDSENYLEKFDSSYEEIADTMNGGVDTVDLGIKCSECGSMETIKMV